jgi:hypothetical protein
LFPSVDPCGDAVDGGRLIEPFDPLRLVNDGEFDEFGVPANFATCEPVKPTENGFRLFFFVVVLLSLSEWALT